MRFQTSRWVGARDARLRDLADARSCDVVPFFYTVGSVKPCKGFASLFSLLHAGDVPKTRRPKTLRTSARRTGPRGTAWKRRHMHRPQSRYSVSSGRSGHATLHTPSAPPQCAQGSITRAASAPGAVDSIFPTARWFLIVPSYRNLTVRSSWQAADARTGRNDSARPGQVADSPKFNSKWARAASRRRKFDFAGNRKFGPRAVPFPRRRGIQLRPATVICACRGARTSRTTTTCAGALYRAGISPIR